MRLAIILTLAVGVYAARSRKEKVDAVVTLVAGEQSGYDSGAIALGQSLINVKSKLHRVLMVTPEVAKVFAL